MLKFCSSLVFSSEQIGHKLWFSFQNNSLENTFPERTCSLQEIVMIHVHSVWHKMQHFRSDSDCGHKRRRMMTLGRQVTSVSCSDAAVQILSLHQFYHFDYLSHRNQLDVSNRFVCYQSSADTAPCVSLTTCWHTCRTSVTPRRGDASLPPHSVSSHQERRVIES